MCPGAAVSCADILALAARDSVAMVSYYYYDSYARIWVEVIWNMSLSDMNWRVNIIFFIYSLCVLLPF